jgi:type VI secretion system secreted protein Hcp
MAMDACVKAKGMKQGDFKGGNAIKGREGTSTVIEFHGGAVIPHDTLSGMASGKRRYEPVTFTTEWDKATANYQTALSTNETVEQVLISFFRPATAGLAQAGGKASVGGESKPYATIELKNAVVVGVELILPFLRDREGLYMHAELIKVSMVFQDITWTWTDGGITFTDTWAGPQ